MSTNDSTPKPFEPQVTTPKTIIRTPKERHYFSVSRATAQDATLSFEARGVLLYLLSKPDDWTVQIADLMREGGIGRDKAKAILKELRAAGYIETEITHDDDGRFSGKIDRIYETRRSTEKPSDGESSARIIHPLHNTESLENTELASGDAKPAKPPKAKKERPRNPMFDAIALVFGYTDEKKPTPTEGGLIGKVSAELTTAGYTPDQIPAIYAYCVQQGFKAFTARALAAHAGNWKRVSGNSTNPMQGLRRITDADVEGL